MKIRAASVFAAKLTLSVTFGCGALLGLGDLVADRDGLDGGSPEAETLFPDLCKVEEAGPFAYEPPASGETVECGSGRVDRTTNTKHCGQCGHACEAECRGGYCVPVPFATLETPFEFTYDSLVGSSDESYVYAQARGYGDASTLNMGFAVPLDGGTIRQTRVTRGLSRGILPVSDAVALLTNERIALLPLDGGGAYFETNVYETRGNVTRTDRWLFHVKNGTIVRTSLEDGGQTIWAPDQNSWALGGDHDSVYWVLRDADGGTPIWRSGDDSSNATLVTRGGPGTQVMAVSGAYVYWVEKPPGAAGRILRAAKTGGIPEVVSILPVPLYDTTFLRVDGDDIFVSSNAQGDESVRYALRASIVVTVPRCGGPVHVLHWVPEVDVDGPGAFGLATDARYVYFGTNHDRQVLRIPR